MPRLVLSHLLMRSHKSHQEQQQHQHHLPDDSAPVLSVSLQPATMFNKLKASVKEHLAEQRQHSVGSNHPHEPDHGQVQPAAYWQASMRPDVPLVHDWRQETGASGWGNAELQDYTTDERNSHIVPNGLSLRAIIEPQRITSARLTSHQTLGRDKGYLMARITAPSAKGIWPAFWMLPSEPFSWPTDGEVDIFETWNGSPINHSCLHWGQYNGEDHDKHRVIDTSVNDLTTAQGHAYGFAWDESKKPGKLIWYIDERPVMRAEVPQGLRPMRDFQVKLNIACGGNVMQGQRPDVGVYEMLVHELGMFEAPPGGWGRFEEHCTTTVEGKGY